VSPLAQGLRWTTLGAALGAVLLAVPGLAGGRLELQAIRIEGAPEIDVSQGPNLTPPGFDAAFFAEQRAPNGELEWRFDGRQAIAESFSAGRCREPRLTVYAPGGLPAFAVAAAEARVVARDPLGRAWTPGGSGSVRDLAVELLGGVTLEAGGLTLDAARGEAFLMRPNVALNEDEEPPPADPRAEVARLELYGPIRVHGQGPAGEAVEVRAERVTLIARGATPPAAAWLELDAEGLDGAWGDARLACARARARLARLPSVARAACGGVAGAYHPGPALSVGSARFLLEDGALEGDVRAGQGDLSASATRVVRVGQAWVARGEPVRVETASGSWLEAPRLALTLGATPTLRARGAVRGEAVGDVGSATAPRRWAISGSELLLSGPLPAAGEPIRRGRVRLRGSPARVHDPAGSSRIDAAAIELRQDEGERSLALSGGATLELDAALTRGEPLRAHVEAAELELDGVAPVGSQGVAELGSLRPSSVASLRLRGLERFAWGPSSGRAAELDYSRRGERGFLQARGLDLSLAAVSSEAAAPLRVRGQTARAWLDPAGLEGRADGLVRLARTLERAELVGDALVGRGGDEPRALSARELHLRDRVLRASGDVVLSGRGPSGSWRFGADQATATLDPDPEVWGQTRPLRRAARDAGIAFLPPPFLRELRLEQQVHGELRVAATATRPARALTLRGERFAYRADTRVARLTGDPLAIGGLQRRELEASELALWWTLIGDRPLVWATARGPSLRSPAPDPAAKPDPSVEPDPLAGTTARAGWVNALFYSAFPGPRYPPLAAWSAGGSAGVRVDGEGELAVRLRAPALHGSGRRLLIPNGPVQLTHGEVELEAQRGSLEWRGETVAAELDGGWSSTFALPAKDGQPPPPDARYRAHGEALALEVDLAAAAELQRAGRGDPTLAQRALRGLSARGGIEVQGPNLRAEGDAAERTPESPITWLTGAPARVQRGGLSYTGRRLELELR